MNIVFKYFVDDVREVVAFGTVTIVVFTLVVGFGDGYVKPCPCFLNVLRNFGQIREFQWSSILFDEVHYGDSMEFKIVVAVELELFRGEVESLVDEVNVLVFHDCFWFVLKEDCKCK